MRIIEDRDVERTIHCQCGEITSVRCEWVGPAGETVLVEHMPEYLRASHEAANNRGIYPHNGSVRLRVEHTCAERLIDDDWTTIVED